MEATVAVRRRGTEEEEETTVDAVALVRTTATTIDHHELNRSPLMKTATTTIGESPHSTSSSRVLILLVRDFLILIAFPLFSLFLSVR